MSDARMGRDGLVIRKLEPEPPHDWISEALKLRAELTRLTQALADRERRIERLTEALNAIKQFGELACVDASSGWTGGKKPATKDVWQFPRHLLTEIDQALSSIPAEGPSTPDQEKTE